MKGERKIEKDKYKEREWKKGERETETERDRKKMGNSRGGSSKLIFWG